MHHANIFDKDGYKDKRGLKGKMNLANKLTILRIILVPVFLWAFFAYSGTDSSFWAAIVFVAATLTDGLDGYIARSRRQITNLGKFMDPLADKMIISAALIALVGMGSLPAWIVVAIICREFAVTGLRAIAAAEGTVIQASLLGKAKTFVQSLAITVILFQDVPVVTGIISQNVMHTCGLVLIYLALFLTIYSGIDYIIKCFPMLVADRSKKAQLPDIKSTESENK